MAGLDTPKVNDGLDQPTSAFADVVSNVWHKAGMGKSSYANLDKEADQIVSNIRSQQNSLGDQVQRDYMQDVFEQARASGDSDYLVKKINTELSRNRDTRRIHFQSAVGDEDRTEHGKISLVEPQGGTAYKEVASMTYNRKVDKQAADLAGLLCPTGKADPVGEGDDWISSSNTSLSLAKVWSALNEARKNGTDKELFERIKDHVIRNPAHANLSPDSDKFKDYLSLRPITDEELKYNPATGEVSLRAGNGQDIKCGYPREMMGNADKVAETLHQGGVTSEQKKQLVDAFLRAYADGKGTEFQESVNLQLALKGDGRRLNFISAQQKFAPNSNTLVPETPRIAIFSPSQGRANADGPCYEKESISIDLKDLEAAREKLIAKN